MLQADNQINLLAARCGINAPIDLEALQRKTDMGYVNIDGRETSVYFQNGMDNSPQAALASAQLVQKAIGQSTGLINNKTDGLAGDVGEYLPNTLSMKDILNEYTYRTLNAKGVPTLIVTHSAGNEDAKKALQAGALYEHKYPNLSLISMGSPVSSATLSNAADSTGVSFIGQINDWRDPVTYAKTAGAVIAGSSIVGLAAGIWYGAGVGVSYGQLGGIAGAAVGAGVGAGLGAGIGGVAFLGLKTYHPMTNYIQKQETAELVKQWKAKQIARN
jgi:filamentous hemagglutinin